MEGEGCLQISNLKIEDLSKKEIRRSVRWDTHETIETNFELQERELFCFTNNKKMTNFEKFRQNFRFCWIKSMKIILNIVCIVFETIIIILEKILGLLRSIFIFFLQLICSFIVFIYFICSSFFPQYGKNPFNSTIHNKKIEEVYCNISKPRIIFISLDPVLGYFSDKAPEDKKAIFLKKDRFSKKGISLIFVPRRNIKQLVK